MYRFPLIVPLVAIIAGCSSGGGPQPSSPPPPEVTVASVILREESTWVDLTGRIEAVDRVEIRPRVGGAIQRVAFTEGSLVAAGDLLFEIDPRPFLAVAQRAAAQLAEAKAQLERATRDLQRTQRLVDRDAVSAEVHDQRTQAVASATARVAAAEADLAAAQLDVEYTRIVAPVAGRVGVAAVTTGNLVAPGSGPLTTVVSVDPVRVTLDLDERTWSTARRFLGSGTSERLIQVRTDGDEGHPHQARLDFVDNHIDGSIGTIRLRGVIANPAGDLVPGAFAQVRLPISVPAPRLLVDARAVGTDQGRKYVLVLGEGDKAEYRPVTVGAVVGSLRVIEGGLEPNDTVIVNGLQRVRPGMAVTAQRIDLRPEVVAKAASNGDEQ